MKTPSPTAHSWKLVSDEVQERDLRYVLVQEAGNISRAAAFMKMARSHLYYLLKKHNLVELASKLRLEAGAARVRVGERQGLVLGRPRKSTSKNK